VKEKKYDAIVISAFTRSKNAPSLLQTITNIGVALLQKTE
jgi:hypothetical protein